MPNNARLVTKGAWSRELRCHANPTPLFEGRSQHSCSELSIAWLCVRQCYLRGVLVTRWVFQIEASRVLLFGPVLAGGSLRCSFAAEGGVTKEKACGLLSDKLMRDRSEI